MNKEQYERVQRGEIVWKKKNSKDRISWKYCDEDNMVFRFDDDPDTEYYLYRDYHRLTPEQKRIFDEENPFWKKFFGKNSLEKILWKVI